MIHVKIHTSFLTKQMMININCGNQIGGDDEDEDSYNCGYSTIISEYDSNYVSEINIECNLGIYLCYELNVVSIGNTNININCLEGRDLCYDMTVFGLFSNEVVVNCSDYVTDGGESDPYNNQNCGYLHTLCPYDGTCTVNLTNSYDYEPVYIASYTGTNNLNYFHPTKSKNNIYNVTNAGNVMFSYGMYIKQLTQKTFSIRIYFCFFHYPCVVLFVVFAILEKKEKKI